MNPQKLLRWTAIPGVLGGFLYMIYSYAPFAFYLTHPGLLDKLWVLGIFLTLFWFVGIYGVQKKEIKGLGLMGMVFCLVASIPILIWVFIRSVSELPMPPIWWVDISLVFMVWGILLLGTLTLKAGCFPRLPTLLWMIGFALPWSGHGYMWPGTYLLIGAGVMWSSWYLWFGGMPERKETATLEVSSIKGMRYPALDMLRGLIMILMPIDHANALLRGSHTLEFWNNAAPFFANAAEFLTRFVTHFCAPGFFFLMGTGMVLFTESRRQVSWSQGKIMRQLALRGFLFIGLEKILWDPLLYGSMQFTKFGVFYGLGTAMIFGTLFLRFNRPALLGIGVGGILITQILPPGLEKLGLYYHPLSYLLFVPQAYGQWFIIYPTLPWLSITLLGMVLGKELLLNQERAFRRILWAGVTFLILFFIVRAIGGFGNFQPANGSHWIDFLNVIKYPPSLVFTLITLGIDMILLYFFAKAGHLFEKWLKLLQVFGKTALYFYFAHWFLFGALGFIFYYFKLKDIRLMYLGWAAGIAMLYPVCRQYLDFKQRTDPNSIWRFI